MLLDRTGRLRAGELFEHRTHERHHVLRSSTRDEIAVMYDCLVKPYGPGVDHVVTDARPGSERAARKQSGRRKDPRAVTERRDRFAGAIERRHEFASGRGLAQQIRVDEPAGYQQRVVTA